MKENSKSIKGMIKKKVKRKSARRTKRRRKKKNVKRYKLFFQNLLVKSKKFLEEWWNKVAREERTNNFSLLSSYSIFLTFFFNLFLYTFFKKCCQLCNYFNHNSYFKAYYRLTFIYFYVRYLTQIYSKVLEDFKCWVNSWLLLFPL